MEPIPSAAAEPAFDLEKLTSGLAVGDDDAWRAFHREFYPVLLRYAGARCRPGDDAAEVVQLTYLRIARHIRPFRSGDSFRAWLACIVRCVAVDFARGMNRRGVLAERFAHWQESRRGPGAGLAEPEPMLRLTSEALACLSDDDADLLRRKYCDGWSTAELARSGDTTPKAIENRLSRARQKLREAFWNLR